MSTCYLCQSKDSYLGLCSCCWYYFTRGRTVHRLCAVCMTEWDDSFSCRCQGTPAQTVRLVRTNDPLTKKLIAAFKFAGERNLARLIAQDMVEAFSAEWFARSCLVPIPSPSYSHWTRGFSGALEIVRNVASITQVPVMQLLKNVGSESQKQRTKDQRKSTTFSLKKLNKAFELSSERIILVDDVLTTGSTIAKAKEVLGLSLNVPMDAIVWAQYL